MLQSTSPPLPLTAGRSPWLRGTLRVPGDPLQSQLALILAAMGDGESIIAQSSGGPEIGATIRALEQLGAHFEFIDECWHVLGLGIGGFLAPRAPIDLSEMGEGAPVLIGLLGAHEFDTVFTGVPASPVIDALLDFLRRNGASIELGTGSVQVRGPRFGIPLDLALSTEAKGLIAPLMFHSLVIAGRTVLHLPGSVVDPAQGLLTQFGARIETRGTRLELDGLAPLQPQQLAVPGDASLAAIAIAAALIAPDSEITVESVALGEVASSLLQAFNRLGADITVAETEYSGGGLVDITAQHGKLTGAVIPAEPFIATEDLAALAVVAAFAEGATTLEGLGEGARRLSLTRALRANGVECVEQAGGGLLIRGKSRIPGGGSIVTRLDPKLAMAFLVLGLAADRPVTIDDGGVVSSLFPDFVPAFEHLGARFSGELAK
jgi:3-phosphoshikimate 1-carboxyvinyltransferase